MGKPSMKRSLKDEKNTLGVFGWLVFGIFAIYMLILLVPYVYALFSSVSTYGDWKESVFPFPKSGLQLKNFQDAWENLKTEDGSGIPQMIMNSLWFAGGSAVLGVLISTCGAYVCCKYKFRGSKFLYWFALITMMIPIVGSMPSTLKYVSALGVDNSPFYVFAMVQTVGASFIIMYSCFQNVDWAYAESAFMDGAGHFTVFFKIMLPQVISPMTALILSDFILFWADAESSLVYYPELPTLATGLYYFRSDVTTTMGALRYPAYFAAMLLCIIPTVTLFAIFQKKLMDIQLGGGIKG